MRCILAIRFIIWKLVVSPPLYCVLTAKVNIVVSFIFVLINFCEYSLTF